jgi:hypothetical protein
MIKDNDFIEICSDDTFGRAVERVAVNSGSFTELVHDCGLNPLEDFRFVNLDEVDFSGADLRGFDFTGSSLRDTRWTGTKFDETTVTLGADLTGSGFEREVTIDEVIIHPDEILRRHWTEVVMWMDGIQPEQIDTTENLEKVLVTFVSAKDSFIRRTALRTLSRFMSFTQLLAILRTAVFDKDDKQLISTAFDLLSQFFPTHQQEVVKFTTPFLAGEYAAEAASFLATHLQSRFAVRSLIELMSRKPERIDRLRFISAYVRSRGAVSMLIVRDPIEGDPFDFGSTIDPLRVALRSRAIARMASEERRNSRIQGEFLSFFNVPREEVEFQVLRVLRELSAFGFNWQIPRTAEMFRYQEERRRVEAREGRSYRDFL